MRFGFAFLTKPGLIFPLHANFFGIQDISRTPGHRALDFKRDRSGDEQNVDVVFWLSSVFGDCGSSPDSIHFFWHGCGDSHRPAEGDLWDPVPSGSVMDN